MADEQKELEDQIAEGTKEFEEKYAVARFVLDTSSLACMICSHL